MTDEEIYNSMQRKRLSKSKPGSGADLNPKFRYRREAIHLLDIIQSHDLNIEGLTDEDVKFAAQMYREITTNENFDPSDKQIFWLRDIKDKLL